MFLCEENEAETSIAGAPEKVSFPILHCLLISCMLTHALKLQALLLAKELGKAVTQERALATLVQFLSASDDHVAEFIRSGLSAVNCYLSSNDSVLQQLFFCLAE